MATPLNNPQAYRFIDMTLAPLVIKTLAAKKIKLSKKNTTTKQDIILSGKLNGVSCQLSPTITYYEHDCIGISLHKMMYSKNIVTVFNGMVYIINSDVLRANWHSSNACYVQRRTYTDARGTESQMTRFKLDWIDNNADWAFEIDADEYAKYVDKLQTIS